MAPQIFGTKVPPTRQAFGKGLQTTPLGSKLTAES